MISSCPKFNLKPAMKLGTLLGRVAHVTQPFLVTMAIVVVIVTQPYAPIYDDCELVYYSKPISAVICYCLGNSLREKHLKASIFFSSQSRSTFDQFWIAALLLLAGDVESNPGPAVMNVKKDGTLKAGLRY